MAKKREPESKPVEEEEVEEVEEVEEEEIEEEAEGEEEESGEEEEDGEDDESEGEEEEEDDDADSSSREAIRKLLEPFGKDQLIDLLKDAALKDPTLLSRISVTPPPAEPATPVYTDPALRKIFIYGLGWDATTDALSAAFAPFGEIEECRAVMDRDTGRCKGFGFVLFRTAAAASQALQEPQKKIGQRTTTCQLASLGRPAASSQPAPQVGMFGQGLNPMGGLLSQGLNPAGFMGQGLNTAGFMGQGLNPAVGLMGQGMNLSSAFAGHSALGMSSSLNRADGTSPYMAGLGFGGGPSGVNEVSPSVIGRYGSPSALQDTGRYQSNLYSSASGMRSQSGAGSLGGYTPSYLGPY